MYFIRMVIYLINSVCIFTNKCMSYGKITSVVSEYCYVIALHYQPL